MSVNDKFDEWLLLLGIALRNRETRGLLLGISGPTPILEKASLKKKNNNSKEGAFKIQGKKCTTLTIHKWKSDFDTNQYFNNLTACYQNTAYSASL